MKSQEIFFPFDPVAKGRPKFTRMGHAYTPKKTADYEKAIREHYQTEGGALFDGAIEVRLEFLMPVPKSFPKKIHKQIEEGTLKHTKKPDADNLAKAILDALNEVAFTDDSHITKLTLIKKYSFNSGTIMTIKEDVD
jgi:Holliday junction resolvase RusA-like endonuclease